MGVKGRGRRGAKVDCLSGDLSWVRWNDDDGAAAAAAAAEGRWLDGIESSQAQQRERSGLLYNSIPSASSEFFSSFKHSTAQHTFVQVGLLRPSSREEKRIREQRTKKITKLNKKEELWFAVSCSPSPHARVEKRKKKKRLSNLRKQPRSKNASKQASRFQRETEATRQGAGR